MNWRTKLSYNQQTLEQIPIEWGFEYLMRATPKDPLMTCFQFFKDMD